MAAIYLPSIDSGRPFPPVETALREPDGLLAFGGDLSSSRLIDAYRSGIFPWFNEEEPILWWSPSQRCIVDYQSFYLSKSMAKTLRKSDFEFTINVAFKEVIQHCAHIPRFQAGRPSSGTWITNSMINAYMSLHNLGFAHSIEVWENRNLVGGLYGIVTDSVFCGESMFHRASNASKAAMAMLIQLLSPFKQSFVDCQMPTEHLSSLGASTLSRHAFLKRLKNANRQSLPNELWQARKLSYCPV